MPKVDPGSRSRAVIETEAIIVAYAMSRLDELFLRRFGYLSWRSAFAGVSTHFGIPPSSIKNLRDEFDPFHANNRKGWHKRPLRSNRQRVLGEFCGMSDEALFEIVTRLFAHDSEATSLISQPLTENRSHSVNVAERLRTGRLAEEYFVANSDRICGITSDRLIDVRLNACGFDFAVQDSPTLAIEVKGLKARRGDILFTDHEWGQANRRTDHYWLVVVGSIETTPAARLIAHPAATLSVSSVIRQTTSFGWLAKVAVA